MHRRLFITVPILLAVLFYEVYFYITYTNINENQSAGAVIDQLNTVKVYFNGGVNQISSRNLTSDGYNLGLKYQCVEYVKRYYYERFHHKMPDAMGHAKDFFDFKLADAELNQKRNLIQFRNGSSIRPEAEDIIVFAPTIFNPYGHVAIISQVFDNSIQIIQQNAGPFSSSRDSYHLRYENDRWYVDGKKTLGWLRMRVSDMQ